MTLRLKVKLCGYAAVLCLTPRHWRRSVVKYGVMVSQIKPSNCFRLHSSRWFPKTETLIGNYESSVYLQITKKVFMEKWHTSITFILDSHECLILQWRDCNPTTVLNERMAFLEGVKTYSDPSYIFSGPQSSGSTPLHWGWTNHCSLYQTKFKLGVRVFPAAHVIARGHLV